MGDASKGDALTLWLAAYTARYRSAYCTVWYEYSPAVYDPPVREYEYEHNRIDVSSYTYWVLVQPIRWGNYF